MKYIKEILSNGMITILVPLKHTSIVAMGFFVRAGARNENNNNNGIAHFLEHMMFKGTTNREPVDMFNQLDKMGTVYNAATSLHDTYYYMYGDNENIKKMMDIIFDMYINPKLGTRDINKERKVIIEEMRMIYDMPINKLYSSLHKKIFADTSLSREVIGTYQTIDNIKRKDFLEFKETYYRPDNTVFVIAGNFNPVPISKLINKHLSRIPIPDNKLKTYYDEKAIIINNIHSQSEPYVSIKKNKFLQQTYVLLSFPFSNDVISDRNTAPFICQLLTSGFSSRLTKALRVDNGITYNINSDTIMYSDASILVISAVINPVEFITGIKIIFRELKKIKSDLITKAEHSKIAQMMKNDILYSFSRPAEIMTYFGLNFAADRGFKPNVKKEIEQLHPITRKKIRDDSNKIFVRNKINMFIYGNVDDTNFDFIDL